MTLELTEIANKIAEYANRDLAKISKQDNDSAKALISAYIEHLITKNSAAESLNILAESRNNILHIAARFGDEIELRKILDFLQSNVNTTPSSESKSQNFKFFIDLRDDKFFTPLHYAAKNSRAEVTKLLLEKGADANCKASAQDREWMPIHYAAKFGSLEIVKILLENKVDKEVKTSFGLTALLVAAEFGHAEIVKFLLSLGANKDVRTVPENHSMSALHYAIVGGFKDVASELIAAGIDVEAKTNEGFTPLHYAASAGDCELANIILQGDNEIDAQNAYGKTAFQLAVEKNRIEMMKLLYRWGVNGCEEALVTARENKSEAVIKELESYQKSLKNLADLKNLPDDFDAVVRSFNQENMHEAKIILKDGLALNAYGIMNLKWKVGLFSKQILNILQIADKAKKEKIFDDLTAIEKMIARLRNF